MNEHTRTEQILNMVVNWKVTVEKRTVCQERKRSRGEEGEKQVRRASSHEVLSSKMGNQGGFYKKK